MAHINIRLRFSAALAVLAVAAASAAQEAKPAAFRLTIDNIMRGEEMIGTSPSDVQWSYDSRILYFRWKKPGATSIAPMCWYREMPPPSTPNPMR